MKILWIYAFLASIAPSTLAGVVSPEAFQNILDQMNKARAEKAVEYNISNMHELRYDQQLAIDAMHQGTCEEGNVDQYFLLPDKATHERYGTKDYFFDEKIKKAPNNESRLGWTAMKRFDQAMNDTRQSKIGCAAHGCNKFGSINGYEYNFKFPLTCAVEHPISDPKQFEEKGKPGEKCPKEKTANNMCVGPPIVPPKSGSPGSPGTSGSSSSQLAVPFIFLSFLILKFL